MAVDLEGAPAGTSYRDATMSTVPVGRRIPLPEVVTPVRATTSREAEAEAAGSNPARANAAPGSAAVEPVGAPGSCPFEQLHVLALEAVERGEQQRAFAAPRQHQVESVVGRDIDDDIDPRRHRLQIIGGQLRRNAGIAQRPVEPVGDGTLDPDLVAAD